MSEQLRYQLRCPGLQLAVYREIAAHLRCVQGVKTDLIPQTSGKFDYNQSQVDGLWIQYENTTDLAQQERVNQILAYYQNRYGVWQKESFPATP